MRFCLIFVTGLFLTSVLATEAGPTVLDLGFMDGVWRRSDQGQVVEEWWMPAAGGTKVASFRWVRDDKLLVIELVIISTEAAGTFLRFKHFNADYSVWEKDEPITYRLVVVEDDLARFDRVGESAQVPAAFIYERRGDTLHFRGTNTPDEPPREEDLLLEFDRVAL